MKSKEISTLRATLGLTKTELAAGLSITLSTYYRWESGESEVQSIHLVLLRAIQRAIADVPEATSSTSERAIAVAEIANKIRLGVGALVYYGLTHRAVRADDLNTPDRPRKKKE